MTRPTAFLLAALVVAAPLADAASTPAPASKPPKTITGVERAQRCMEMKNRQDEAKTKPKAAGKAASKPTEREQQDLDWYRKNCK